MRKIPPLLLSGKEVLPLVEGGKGISVSNGISSGAWAASGGVGTFSGVNADSYDEQGQPIPYSYCGKNRRERHIELIERSIKGAITQARRAYDVSGFMETSLLQIPKNDGGCRLRRSMARRWP